MFQASAASAAALSLCLLFGGALPEDGEVVVIGYFDLTGSVRTVSSKKQLATPHLLSAFLTMKRPSDFSLSPYCCCVTSQFVIGLCVG